MRKVSLILADTIKEMKGFTHKQNSFLCMLTNITSWQLGHMHQNDCMGDILITYTTFTLRSNGDCRHNITN